MEIDESLQLQCDELLPELLQQKRAADEEAKKKKDEEDKKKKVRTKTNEK